MTALTKVRTEHQISDEIHAMMLLYPSKANDHDWIVSEVAEVHGRAENDVRRVWDARFKDHGVA